MQTVASKQAIETVFSIAKVYPDFIKHIIYATPRVMLKSGLESTSKQTNKKTNKSQSIQSKIDSIRRSKTTIQDIILCNDFDMFATFTFNKDRQDIQKSKTKMSMWLKSQQNDTDHLCILLFQNFTKTAKRFISTR